ncbi:Aldehyde oxidase and xanthine dehydrogenase, a/b hammerhead domain [Fulvimarina manganoxydans]|uniref:Aldehyde oxidase and xanthine dehydrogenase, a/b hammerhead domain n=1 Tax=Fulvimarina manganoxydans TaxID=937218 RepID=A0A1W1ZCU2_9HYPH|nr:Aldehyde oxidase and xanthine dehydrogenase, a/b hammerhead domain [Fulvimarina manganoxydans]
MKDSATLSAILDGDHATISGTVYRDRIHDSAAKHVTGRADYTDDIAQPEGTLHAYLGLSQVAHARIRGLDLSAVRAAPGVVDVLTVDDIPGTNDISPTGKHDEPVFPTEEIQFHGQPLFAVIAETRDAARWAAVLAKVDCEELPFALDPRAAREAGYPYVAPPLKLERGDVDPAFAAAPRRASSMAPSPSAGRTTCISRARSPSRSPARMTTWSSTARPSIRPRPSIWWPMCWAFPPMP